MQALAPPDSFVVDAAQGWLGLGNPAEARAELGRISEANREHPQVLETLWQLEAAEADWDAARAAAERLLKLLPDDPRAWLHHAYALRRAKAGGGLRAAWYALSPALEKFPREPTVPYNLACYACQLRQLDEARALLKRALAAGGRENIKRMALQDSDLAALWGEIRNW